uniref:Uroporphyrinogen decarboxylase (URO-D) domain-containing protein n=1 Tax=candidate division WOR-3 bacterium TaxID=2052148 RepID=A0A7C4GFC5_UNCW3
MNPVGRSALFRRDAGDSGPVVVPMVAANHAARIAGISVREVVTDAGALVSALHAAYRRYEYDGIVVFTDTVVEAEAMGCRVQIPADDDPYLVESPTARRLEPVDPEEVGRMPVVLAAIRRLVELTGGLVPVLGSLKGPFSLASFLAGPDRFFADLLERPDRARETLLVATDNQRWYQSAIIRAGGLPFIGDPVASGSMISPEMFREFAWPYIARLVEDAHALGVPVGLHVCGDTTSMLGHMRDTGSDFVSIDDIDIARARRDLGANTTIMGNVSTRLLLEGAPEQVRRAAERCLELALPRLILSSACDVAPDTPEANVKALVQAAREWGRE